MADADTEYLQISSLIKNKPKMTNQALILMAAPLLHYQTNQPLLDVL